MKAFRSASAGSVANRVPTCTAANRDPTCTAASSVPTIFRSSGVAFATLDATVRYISPAENWNVELFVYNATDERFPTYWEGSSRPGAPLFTWNAPRTWGLRAAYNLRP